MKNATSTKRPSLARNQTLPALVHFEYVDTRAESVCLAGSFNDWNSTAMPMIASSPGVWQKDLALAPGSYEYALVIDGHWKHDPRCAEQVNNPFGGLNSVVRVPTVAGVKH